MTWDFTILDWVGIAGSLVIAGAYFAVSYGWVRGDAPAFHLMNLLGAALVLSSLWARPNAGAIMIEVLWVLIALAALARWLWMRR